MAQVLVISVPGRKVRDPKQLQPRVGKKGSGIAGAVTVNDSDPFWARRILFGDVAVTTKEAEAEKARVAADKAKVAADQNRLAADER